MLKLGLVCILRIMVAPLRIQVVLIPNKCSFSILTFAESIGVLFGQFTRKVFSLFSLMWPIFIFTNSCVCVQRETIIAAHWQLCFICNAWAASICSSAVCPSLRAFALEHISQHQSANSWCHFREQLTNEGGSSQSTSGPGDGGRWSL